MHAEQQLTRIGSENQLFSLSGSSTIAAPFRDAEERIVGVAWPAAENRVVVLELTN